ncbi:MAG TPA: hypothetical protein VJS91_06355 [Nitrososphaeraceae archaeon]|nr:hypothetical protein [Nitrososphaeraceae archaeon]
MLSKNIHVATFLAGFFPSMGHIYLGAIQRGLIVLFIMVFLSITWIFVPRFVPYPYGWIIVAGFWIWQVIDVRRIYRKRI